MKNFMSAFLLKETKSHYGLYTNTYKEITQHEKTKCKKSFKINLSLSLYYTTLMNAK